MQRARLILAAFAIVVAAITTSQEYRVLMLNCDAFSIAWYERIGVVSAFIVLYAGAAYLLLKIALTNRLQDRSWPRSFLIFALALCFGAVTVFSAPSVLTALQLAEGAGFHAVLDSTFGVAAAELASYPNLSGAMIGAFFFQTVAIVAQELRARGHMRLAPQ